MPRPRPDYAVKQGRKVVTLLDAKYRDLWEKSLLRDMLYQLSVYALRQPRSSTAAILYPTDAPIASASGGEINELELSKYLNERSTARPHGRDTNCCFVWV